MKHATTRATAPGWCALARRLSWLTGECRHQRRTVHLRMLAVAELAMLAPFLAACATSATTGQDSRTLQVIAGENFWGSIAAQLGGAHVSVTSIVTDPNADPHEYESNTADARAFATARYVILNGAGYDTWGQKLLDANPADGRMVLTVADLLGKHEGDNPHFWYNPRMWSRSPTASPAITRGWTQRMRPISRSSGARSRPR